MYSENCENMSFFVSIFNCLMFVIRILTFWVTKSLLTQYGCSRENIMHRYFITCTYRSNNRTVIEWNTRKMTVALQQTTDWFGTFIFWYACLLILTVRTNSRSNFNDLILEMCVSYCVFMYQNSTLFVRISKITNFPSASI